MTAPFDPAAPLPDPHTPVRGWEPAVRHYRDLTEEERSEHQEGTR